MSLFGTKYRTTFVIPFFSDQKPDVMYADIGGMDIQKQEVREAVELPLTHFELYKQVTHMDAKKRTAWPKQMSTLCYNHS